MIQMSLRSLENVEKKMMMEAEFGKADENAI